MTSHSLAEDYLRWLAPQVREWSHDEESYWNLLVIMHEKEFSRERLVPNDENRLADGLALRTEFCYAHHVRQGSLADLGPCTFLEVLIGLSRRMAFELGGISTNWAWVLVSNLEMHKMSDPLSNYKSKKANDILDRCIWREYKEDGVGGFFPLAWPNEDQRYVELWYQMAAWIHERPPE